MEQNNLLKEFLEEFKKQKEELSVRLDIQEKKLNNLLINMTELEKNVSKHNRTLYGEEQDGFKGIVKTMKDTNDTINNLNTSLNDFMNTFKNKELIKENTFKNINFLYTFMSSTGFIYICSILYKLLIKK